ncbi:MAG: multiple sugar transport system permease protein [Clostridiales bacterium]|nr:multiple sugar transport system permease protein [Clostridiales bacterium]
MISSSKVFHNRRKSKLEAQEALTGWLFILPAIIGLSIFIYGAVIYSLGISFTEWDLLTPAIWIGFSNYSKIFTDQTFLQCLYNTIFFVIVMVPFGIIFSMAMAIALNYPIKGLSFFRAAFYMPSITSTIAIGMVWLWILNPDQGILNAILRGIGITNPPRWLESVVWAKPALAIMRLWQVSGYYMIMYLAGLQSIPTELYEAADMDGAGFWQKTRYITIPMLSNTTFFVMIMLIIESFNIFEAIYVMTEGSPGGSTNTLLYYIYTEAFQSYRMGYAASLAWVLFMILFVLTMIQFMIRRKSEQENA